VPNNTYAQRPPVFGTLYRIAIIYQGSRAQPRPRAHRGDVPPLLAFAKPRITIARDRDWIIDCFAPACCGSTLYYSEAACSWVANRSTSAARRSTLRTLPSSMYRLLRLERDEAYEAEITSMAQSEECA